MTEPTTVTDIDADNDYYWIDVADDEPETVGAFDAVPDDVDTCQHWTGGDPEDPRGDPPRPCDNVPTHTLVAYSNGSDGSLGKIASCDECGLPGMAGKSPTRDNPCDSGVSVARTVKEFVDDYIDTRDADEEMLEISAWKTYNAAVVRGVTESEFREQLPAALPDHVERDGETYHGARLVTGDPDE